MIYDRPVSIYTLSSDGPPQARRLKPHASCYYAEQTVYHRTFFDSLQRGESIDRMITIHRDETVRATMFAVPDDGHVYKITEAQPTHDQDGLPVTVLSLHREEAKYDFVRA